MPAVDDTSSPTTRRTERETTKAGGPGLKSFGDDLLASIVVFFVALPLCIGIAMASGVPPALGLVTGIVGGIVIGALAGSPLQVSGPAAGLAVLVWDLVQREGLGMLGVVVLGAGLIQIAAGVFKIGRWFMAVSPSVIQGMLSGIGVLIFANQFHVMVDDLPPGGGVMNLVSIPMAIYKGIDPGTGDRAHHVAAGIGILTIVVLLLWDKLRPKRLSFVPAALVAVGVATGVAAGFAAPVLYIDVPESLLASLNVPAIESLQRALEPGIVGEMFAFALIASAETLLCATAVDRIHDGPRTRYNKELIAQGVGNMVCGVAGALPATGVIVRSSANVEAGAKTRWSAVLHGVWLLAIVALVPAVLALVPKAALAAILVVIGYKLLNPTAIRKLWESGGKAEVGVFFITLVAIVSTDLLTGVMLGFALSVGKLLYTFTHLEIDILEESEERHDICLHGAATFVRLPDLSQALEAAPTDKEIHIHIGGLAYVDHAILELLRGYETRIENQGGAVKIDWDDMGARAGSRMHLHAPEAPARTARAAKEATEPG